MNIRYKVYYKTPGEEDVRWPTSWKDALPHKRIRASSEEKAMEIFKTKYPGLIPVLASLY